MRVFKSDYIRMRVLQFIVYKKYIKKMLLRSYADAFRQLGAGKSVG